MSQDTSTVGIDELNQLWGKVVAKIAFTFDERVNLGEIDYYWNVDSSVAFDTSKEEAPVVGSLFDDVQELRKLLSEIERPTTVVDLERFSSLIKAIAYLALVEK